MATTYEKHYIGKGKQVENLDIIRMVIPVENIQGAIFEKEGQKYLAFEVAKLQNPDKYGRTHTCYFSTKKQEEPKPAEKKAKNGKKAPKHEPAEDDLPF